MHVRGLRGELMELLWAREGGMRIGCGSEGGHASYDAVGWGAADGYHEGKKVGDISVPRLRLKMAAWDDVVFVPAGGAVEGVKAPE
jgi:hypothetical protein